MHVTAPTLLFLALGGTTAQLLKPSPFYTLLPLIPAPPTPPAPTTPSPTSPPAAEIIIHPELAYTFYNRPGSILTNPAVAAPTPTNSPSTPTTGGVYTETLPLGRATAVPAVLSAWAACGSAEAQCARGSACLEFKSGVRMCVPDRLSGKGVGGVGNWVVD